MKHKFLSLLAVLAVVANFSWAGTYYLMQNDHSTQGTAVMQCPESSSPYTATWECNATGTFYFYINNGSKDFLNGNQTFSDGAAVQLYEYGTSNYQHSITLNATRTGVYSFSYNSSDKKLTCTFPKDPSAPVSGDLLDVLKGDKVMFYYGDTWGSGTKYLRSSSQTSSTVHSGNNVLSLPTFYKSQTETYSTNKYRCNATCQSAAKYYLSNSSSWGGEQMGEKAVAGKAYILNNHSDLSGNNSNNVFAVPSRSGTTWTNQTASITISATSCNIAATPAYSTSVTYQTNTISYYIKKGDNYSAFDPSNFEVLSVGEYTIWAICSDGYINVRSESSATLTVTSGEAGVHSISYPIAGKWTYGDDKPTQAKKNDPVSFTATPNAGYTLSVSSEQATITAGDNNTYSFTMPDKDVTIKITATAQEFDITYPASPSNYTLDGNNPVKGTTDANVSFTATPAEGYQLSVTSEQVETFAKNGNTYSFTMPAKAVTIAIEATLIPKTTFYFWNSEDWNQVNAYMWEGTASVATWPGTKQTNVIYQSDGHDVYKIEIEQDAHKKVIFNNGSGQQTGNLTIPTSGENICYKGKDGDWMALPKENYAVEVSAGEGGSVTQAGTKYVASTAFTVDANATTGYVFKNWTATGGVVIADDNEASTTITATAMGTLIANFEQDANLFAINFSAEGGSASAKVNGEAISSGTMYTVGESVDVTFSASSSGSKTFYGWYDTDNKKISEENPFTVTGITSTYTIKAVYAGKFYLKHPWNQGDWTVKEVTYDVKTGLYYIYENYGDDGFNYGTTDNPTAWNNKNQTLIDSPAAKDWCYITTTTDGAITVKKVTEKYTITAVAVTEEGSTKVNDIAGAADVLEGKSATLVATAKDGYGFVGWYDNAEKTGEAVSTDATFVIETVFAAATYYAKFEAETQYTVTIDNNIDATTSSTQVGSSAKEVTADAKDGYVFRYWTTDGDIEIAGEDTDNPVSITATGEGTLTANYEAKSYIYLQNTLNWEGNIYAYLFKGDVWDGWVKHKGVVAAAGKMENMGDGLFRFEYDVANPSTYIAFSTNNMVTWGDFNGGKAIYRGDYNRCRRIFVPDASQTPENKNSTDYYNSGYWQTNDTHTGMYFMYTDNWDTDPDREFIREDATATRGMMSIHLEEGTYEFKIKSCSGSYYGNSGKIEDNINLSTEGWTFDADANCTIKATKEGDYTFYYDFVSHKLWVLYPTYFLKHAWPEGEHSWSWKNCDIYDSEAKTYSLYATYEGEGVNYNTKASEDGKGWCSEQDGNLTLIGEPQVGKPARFTFDPATETVTIENMYFPITMNKYGYATLYHKENLLIPEGVTAKYVTGTSGVLLTYQEVDGGVIPKETGVMLFAPANTLMEFEGVDKAKEEAPTNIMDGSHDAETVDNSDIHYILTLNDNNQIGMFWPYDTDEGVGPFTNAANKAYIYVPGTTEQTAPVRARGGYLLSNDVNTPTELVDVNANENANGKVLRNGQLIIIRDGIRYNALGEIVK